jgi:hypothetical protein
MSLRFLFSHHGEIYSNNSNEKLRDVFINYCISSLRKFDVKRTQFLSIKKHIEESILNLYVILPAIIRGKKIQIAGTGLFKEDLPELSKDLDSLSIEELSERLYAINKELEQKKHKCRLFLLKLDETADCPISFNIGSDESSAKRDTNFRDALTFINGENTLELTNSNNTIYEMMLPRYGRDVNRCHGFELLNNSGWLEIMAEHYVMMLLSTNISAVEHKIETVLFACTTFYNEINKESREIFRNYILSNLVLDVNLNTKTKDQIPQFKGWEERFLVDYAEKPSLAIETSRGEIQYNIVETVVKDKMGTRMELYKNFLANFKKMKQLFCKDTSSILGNKRGAILSRNDRKCYHNQICSFTPLRILNADLFNEN